MTQEDKELLLKDLCGRLPHGVKAQYYGSEEEMLTVDTIEAIYTEPSVEIIIGQYGIGIEDIKPYLRPMSSMTEEEKLEFSLVPIYAFVHYNEIAKMDWLNAHHFDYRGLIEKGLAIEVTEDNNPYVEDRDMKPEDFISGGETTTTGGVVSTKYKETCCTHFHSISGLQCWCDKGVFPPDCATCTQGDWKEYWVEVTSTSTNKD